MVANCLKHVELASHLLLNSLPVPYRMPEPMNWLLKTPEVKSVAEIRVLSRDQLACMPVHSNPRLQPLEKETCLNLLGGEKEFTVMSYHPTAIRGFLRQPEFRPTRAFIECMGGQDTIVGIEGVLPLRCLHIGAARRRNFLSTVFARRSGMRSPPNCVSETQDQRPHSKHDGRGTSDEAMTREGDSDTPNCVGTIQ